MKSLIINADDLGFSPQVNEAIIQGGIAQKISAASLLVNMPYAEEAAKAVQKRCPDLSLGLHLTLTCGQSLTSAQSLPNLVDCGSGLFKVGFLSLARALLSQNRRNEYLDEIQREFESQMEMMLQLAKTYQLKFDHLDSHQHVHVLPGIFELLKKEAEKRNLILRIPRERFMGWRRFSHRWSRWIPQGILKRSILNHFLRGVEQKVGYFGILESGKIDLNTLKSIVAAIENDESETDVYELNTHPSSGPSSISVSRADELFHRSPWRKIERDSLLQPEFSQFIEKSSVQIIGFS